MFQVGVDCEEISRFRRLPYNKNKRFYRKIFTEPEINYCVSYKDPYPRFAVRFAAKEAAIKALNSITKAYYADIEVQKDKTAQPRLNVSKKRLKDVSRFAISLSLAHSRSHAIALVVVADKKNSAGEVNRALTKSASYINRKIAR